jgi:hypothetical protein
MLGHVNFDWGWKWSDLEFLPSFLFFLGKRNEILGLVMGCEVGWMVEWMLYCGEGVRGGRVSSRREREWVGGWRDVLKIWCSEKGGVSI